MPERNRFFKGLSSWIGFRQVRVDYEPAARAHGRTTWNVWTLIGLSIEGLTSFSVAPLRLASLLGVLLAGSAIIFGIWIAGGDPALRQGRAGLSLAGRRHHGARRRAAHDDRRARRIYRQDAVRDQSAAGLFRRRAQPEERRRERQAATASGGLPAPRRNRRVADTRHIWLCADDYGISPGGQRRHPRTDRARPAQRHLGDDGGAASSSADEAAALDAAQLPARRAQRSACT